MGFREVLRRVIEWSNRNPGENDNHGKKIIIIRTSVKTWKNRHRLFVRRSGWICSRTEVLITVARDRLFRERIIQIASPAIAFGSCSFPLLLHSRLLLGFQTYYELNLTLGISEVSVRFRQFKFHSLSFVYSLKWLCPSPPHPRHTRSYAAWNWYAGSVVFIAILSCCSCTKWPCYKERTLQVTHTGHFYLETKTKHWRISVWPVYIGEKYCYIILFVSFA